MAREGQQDGLHLFLRLAEEGAYRLIWSEQIRVGLERNLPIVWARVPRADEWTPCGKPFPMPVDSGDRHVAAAAAHAGAEVIVTANRTASLQASD